MDFDPGPALRQVATGIGSEALLIVVVSELKTTDDGNLTHADLCTSLTLAFRGSICHEMSYAPLGAQHFSSTGNPQTTAGRLMAFHFIAFGHDSHLSIYE